MPRTRDGRDGHDDRDGDGDGDGDGRIVPRLTRRATAGSRRRQHIAQYRARGNRARPDRSPAPAAPRERSGPAAPALVQ
ncbi:hypothetical protein Bpla01_47270 [Burkholderia plantarii]|nr:hypothetical protein Bpla01_47270 [Burkholderia plantarii]